MYNFMFKNSNLKSLFEVPNRYWSSTTNTIWDSTIASGVGNLGKDYILVSDSDSDYSTNKFIIKQSNLTSHYNVPYVLKLEPGVIEGIDYTLFIANDYPINGNMYFNSIHPSGWYLYFNKPNHMRTDTRYLAGQWVITDKETNIYIQTADHEVYKGYPPKIAWLPPFINGDLSKQESEIKLGNSYLYEDGYSRESRWNTLGFSLDGITGSVYFHEYTWDPDSYGFINNYYKYKLTMANPENFYFKTTQSTSGIPNYLGINGEYKNYKGEKLIIGCPVYTR